MKRLFSGMIALLAIAGILAAQSPPAGATYVASSAQNPIDPAQQAENIAYLQTSVATLNTNALAGFNGQCGQWTAVASHDRDLNLVLPAKPAQIPAQVLNVSAPDSVGGLWVWYTPGALMGAACPDLPPLVTNQAPANTPDIGAPLGGPWYQCMPDDNLPSNTIVLVTATGWSTPLGTAGTGFASGKQPPAGQYAKTPGVIGCWYDKVQ